MPHAPERAITALILAGALCAGCGADGGGGSVPDTTQTAQGQAGGDPSAPPFAPSTGGASDVVAAPAVFGPDPFTGFWEAVDPVTAAPREVVRIVALTDGEYASTIFLDRAAQGGDVGGNCFDVAGGDVHAVVDGALRPVTRLQAIRNYDEYALEDGFLVLSRRVAPGDPTSRTVYARALPGLAAQDIPVCGATAG